MEADGVRWDERYAGRALTTPAPPAAIADEPSLLSRLPSHGSAADIACGTGAQTLWLAGRGLSVVAVDMSPVAVDLTTRAAEAAGLTARVSARVHDLDEGLPTDATRLDLLICQRFREPAIY
ncbi:MAG: methyltransferase domain-containing protein, partial [Acidimicrobiia bacterium]|nr:methyltransferase domain-containing protein [Acidimicrobiia bacterium]